jgi:signal transduction histidine kinase
LQILSIAVIGMKERVDPDKITSTESHPSAPNAVEREEARWDSSQAKDEVEYPDKARSHLMAKLVHDLGTPILSIRGYTKMILDERAGPISSTQREYLTIAAENANHVIRLVRNLQRLIASQTPHFEVFDARELLGLAMGQTEPCPEPLDPAKEKIGTGIP